MSVQRVSTLVLVLPLFGLSACGSDLDSVRRISVQELRQALERDEAVVVDTRGQGAYDEGHIKGAISIPLSQTAELSSQLPRDRLIVTYCS